LLDRGRRGPRRTLLGIAGAPACGKSTLAEQVVEALGEEAVVVAMDGFHLHDDVLAALGRADRKGAPDTFDADGYAALLHRLRTVERTVYAPAFDRTRELSLAGAVPVTASHRLVVTEGNYLLLGGDDWGSVRPNLDETWFVECDEPLRLARLVQRHVEHGRSPVEAHEWAIGSDQVNARTVAGTRDAADLVVRLS
ncbi:MAG: nucleoside/nucleotide kinase family protein, partial [Nocardioidaceae bacterium]